MSSERETYINNAKTLYSTYKNQEQDVRRNLNDNYYDVIGLTNDAEIQQAATDNGALRLNSDVVQSEIARLSNLVEARDRLFEQIKQLQAKYFTVEAFVDYYKKNNAVATVTQIVTLYEDYMKRNGLQDYESIVTEVDGVLN